jgi:hypothetical protein
MRHSRQLSPLASVWRLGDPVSGALIGMMGKLERSGTRIRIANIVNQLERNKVHCDGAGSLLAT